jgi:hypothetical protein
MRICAVLQRRRSACSSWNTVVLPAPDGPTSATVSPGRDGEIEAVQRGLPRDARDRRSVTASRLDAPQPAQPVTGSRRQAGPPRLAGPADAASAAAEQFEQAARRRRRRAARSPQHLRAQRPPTLGDDQPDVADGLGERRPQLVRPWSTACDAEREPQSTTVPNTPHDQAIAVSDGARRGPARGGRERGLGRGLAKARGLVGLLPGR